MFWLLIILAAAGGTLATYFYDEDAHFLTRLAAGAAAGLAALGLFGFLFASLLGFNTASIIISTLITALPLALLARDDWRARVGFDVRAARRDLAAAFNRPRAGKTSAVVLLLFALVVFWLVFGRTMFERGGAIYTGVDNNLGDLPFHMAIVNGFVHGENFPPVHPEYAGARLTYPFAVDFVAAMFVRAGASLESALFWENLLLALALVVLLYRLALRLTGDRLAAGLACVLTIFSGGLGWVRFLREAAGSSLGLWDFLWRLPRDYTISFDGAYRWGNAVTTLLVPQRGLLMGLPLALLVIAQWWLATGGDAETARRGDAAAEEEGEGGKGKRGKGKKRQAHEPESPPEFSPFAFSPSRHSLSAAERRMLGAGLIAGLLPLVHAHSFVVLMLVAGCLALLLRGWRGWLIFFGAALLVAAPQMFWATRESAARPSSFFEFVFGWDRGKQNPLWFWFRNTGLFIPLLVAALAWRGRRPLVPKRLLVFYLPFTLLFAICNAAKISPWVWDNIKVLFYWYVASVPLVALLLARLWRRDVIARAGCAVIVFALTFAGALDVWRVVSEASEQREFDAGGIAFAEMVRRETAPRSLVLHAPTYNHPVYLSGRQSLMGYGGHLWSQGIDYAPREAVIRRIYTGAFDAPQLLASNNVEYVVVGPLELAPVERGGLQVNETFFSSRYQKVGEAGGYRLYKIRP
jgi:hypothetical protein